MIHEAVLQKEVLQYLDPKPNENFIDCTIGEGGHATAILEKTKPGGKILGIEVDPKLYQELKLRMAEIPNSKLQIPERLILINNSYTNLKKIVEKNKFNQISGILFDLGMSSWHLEKSGRGFSFMRDEPLDMKYSPENFLTAEEIINQWPESKILKILKEYGEERFARKIAKEIVRERETKQIKTTFRLIEVIKRAMPARYQKGRIHLATRTFQALRIAVNNELNNLRKVLPQAIEILAPGGKLVVISFHSLEDRIVKRFFKEKKDIEIITKKPVITSEEEIKTNPRSRSAKLRVAKKI